MTGEAATTVEVLYRDARIAVVNKPAGLASHRGWSDDDDALLQRVRDQLDSFVFLIHRLDRGASGAVVFALDREMARLLSQQFESGTVEKHYVCITRGHPPERVTIDYAIPKREGGPRVDAVTEIVRRATAGRYAWVEAQPKTGRLHQIRRHLKHLACPLIGDVKYGKGEHNRIFRSQHNLHRLALHAQRIHFEHPEAGMRMEVVAPVPSDLVNAWTSCGEAYGG